MPSIAGRNVVYSTPWFKLLEKNVRDGQDADSRYYCLDLPDYVTVFAVRSDGKIPLVRQYRPAVEAMTLELPSGTVDVGESPEEAARRELQEETGHRADRMELLARLRPDTGRLSNWIWCFLASEVQQITEGYVPEPGMEVVLCDATSLSQLISEGKIDHALNVAAIGLAQQRLSKGPHGSPATAQGSIDSTIRG